MDHVEVSGRREKHANTSSHNRSYWGLCDKRGTSETLNVHRRIEREGHILRTDSVIYIQKCGQPPAVTCGDKLVDMTNEIGPDEYLLEFVSGGPRNYAYKVMNARTPEKKTVCKICGITLNYAASQLNFDSIRDMTFGADVKDVITVRAERQ